MKRIMWNVSRSIAFKAFQVKLIHGDQLDRLAGKIDATFGSHYPCRKVITAMDIVRGNY